MAKKKLSGRAERRDLERRAQKLTRDLERLATLAPGGAPDRPIDIDSPSQLEVHARSAPCPLCRGSLRVEEHAAETVDGSRLRIARVVCEACRSRRSLYYRLRGAALN
jgi:hypothetical protein